MTLYSKRWKRTFTIIAGVFFLLFVIVASSILLVKNQALKTEILEARSEQIKENSDSEEVIDYLNYLFEEWRNYSFLLLRIFENENMARLQEFLISMNSEKILPLSCRFDHFYGFSFFVLRDGEKLVIIIVTDEQPEKAFSDEWGCGEVGSIESYLTSFTDEGFGLKEHVGDVTAKIMNEDGTVRDVQFELAADENCILIIESEDKTKVRGTVSENDQ